MKTTDFNVHLPEELLAAHPSEHRDESRLMVLDRKAQTIEHKLFKDVVDYFDEKDLFIFNNTKVFPARLYGNKENTGVQEVSASSQPQQNKNIVSNQNTRQNNKKVENTSTISQNKTEQPKVSNSDSKAPVSQNSSLSAVQPSGNTGKTVQSSGNSSGNTNSSVSGSGNTADASHSGQISGNHATTGSVNGHSSKGSGKSSGESGEGKNTNVCNEGKDFTVSYNPNLKYPVAAQRLGNKGTVVVMVRFRFNSSGSVSVISASGGSGVFQQEAKSAASRIRVNIKNPDTLKCTISKPFKFELK